MADGALIGVRHSLHLATLEREAANVGAVAGSCQVHPKYPLAMISRLASECNGLRTRGNIVPWLSLNTTRSPVNLRRASQDARICRNSLGG